MRAAADVDGFYAPRPPGPARAEVTLVLSFDGKGRFGLLQPSRTDLNVKDPASQTLHSRSPMCPISERQAAGCEPSVVSPK